MLSNNTKMPIPHDIQITLRLLPPGQRSAVEALIGMGWARSYHEAAAACGVCVGTLYTHLRRVRQAHPELYERIMQVRAEQLGVRHIASVKRAEAHSQTWHRKRFRRRYGYWPRRR